MLDLTQLRTFVAVVQEGHLTRAAERLHISQPTASNHIRALEAEFGVQLFHRAARGLEPTAAGQRLAAGAARLLGSSAELSSLARSLQGSPSGRLVIGTVEDRGLLEMLPAVAGWLRERYPLVELGFEARNSLAVRQGIATGELDAGFFLGVALDAELDGFEVKPLEFVVAGPAAWRERLAGADWAALAALPWVVTAAGAPHAELAQRLLRPRGLQPNAAMVVTNEVLVRTMIKGGVGIGFIRREFALEGQADGSFVIVPDTLTRIGLQFAHTRVRQVDPLLDLLARALREVLGKAEHLTQACTH